MHTQVAVIRSWATKMNSFSVSTFVIRLNQDKVSCICHFCIDKVQYKPDLVAMKVNIAYTELIQFVTIFVSCYECIAQQTVIKRFQQKGFKLSLNILQKNITGLKKSTRNRHQNILSLF
jgi:hypothetical protein